MPNGSQAFKVAAVGYHWLGDVLTGRRDGIDRLPHQPIMPDIGHPNRHCVPSRFDCVALRWHCR